MKPIIRLAVSFVSVALICYSVATVSHQRSRLISDKVLRFLGVGVLFDIAATTCMIIAAGGLGLTPHGVLGYSALIAMVTETVLAWRHRRAKGAATPVSDRMALYSRVAYAYWVTAFISGGTMVALASRAARRAASL